MTRIEEIEQAVAALPDDDYRVFRQWFLNRDWEKWDLQIEDDVNEGGLAQRILMAHRATARFWAGYSDLSPEIRSLADSEYAAGHTLDYLRSRSRVTFDRDLHLAVSMRSFRAENVSHFVKAVLDCDEPTARSSYAALSSRYPIALTRNLDHAKRWIRKLELLPRRCCYRVSDAGTGIRLGMCHLGWGSPFRRSRMELPLLSRRRVVQYSQA